MSDLDDRGGQLNDGIFAGKSRKYGGAIYNSFWPHGTKMLRSKWLNMHEVPGTHYMIQIVCNHTGYLKHCRLEFIYFNENLKKKRIKEELMKLERSHIFS